MIFCRTRRGVDRVGKELRGENLERAYGKLMNKRSLIMKNNPNSLELKKIETYLLQIKQRINS